MKHKRKSSKKTAKVPYRIKIRKTTVVKFYKRIKKAKKAKK